MDENCIDLMALSFVSVCNQGLSDPAKAEALATIAYDKLEEVVMKNPTRLAVFAAVSMHDPEQATEELTRCMTKKKGVCWGLVE